MHSTSFQSSVYISLVILFGPWDYEMLKDFNRVLDQHLIISNPYYWLVFIYNLISESHTDSLGLEQQSWASRHIPHRGSHPHIPAPFHPDTKNTGVAPPRPQLLWLLSSWQHELGCWQLLLVGVPVETWETSMPEAGTCKADKICLANRHDVRWGIFKAGATKVNEGFSKVSGFRVSPTWTSWLALTLHEFSPLQGEPGSSWLL